jgi:hypothetical protein
MRDRDSRQHETQKGKEKGKDKVGRDQGERRRHGDGQALLRTQGR